MEQSMRRSMKVDLILHVAYRSTGSGDGPILECLGKVVQDNYFEAVEMTSIDDPDVKTAAAGMMRTSRMAAAYSGQGRTLSKGLDLNNLDEEGRRQAVAVLKEGINQAYELGCVDLSFLSGRYQEETKEQSFEQLLRSTRELCTHTKEKGDMPICCEVFDCGIDKEALIGPAYLAARCTKTIREGFGNFGLMVDLSHIPMIRKTIEESILPVKKYIAHAHMGNTVIRSPEYEAYGDNHPRPGFPGSKNNIPELTRYLRLLLTIGFLNEKTRPIVGFEVKPRKDEWPEVVTVNTKRTLNLAQELVQRCK